MKHLAEYMATFVGYGNVQAPLWFIGMEEGSGTGLDELARRVAAWHERGQRPLEDLGDFHRAIGLDRHFRSPYPLQSTWRPLLRTLLAWRGEASSPRRLREVQASELGTTTGDTALLELLPLPAPSVAHWPYATLAPAHPELVDRRTYRTMTEPRRLETLQRLVRRAMPSVVVCYGLQYRAAWASLSEGELVEQHLAGVRYWRGAHAKTVVLVVPHPVARGASSAFWEGLGRQASGRTV